MASLTRLRKRPRSEAPRQDDDSDDSGGGGVFGERSDSDDDNASKAPSAARPTVLTNGTSPHPIPPLTNKATAPPNAEASNADEDTLDAFMSSLGDATRPSNPQRAPHQLTPCSSRSSSPTPPSAAQRVPADRGKEELSIEEAARRADREKRSLALAAVDHSKVEYAPLERVLRPAPKVSAEELSSRIEAAGVTMSGAAVCPIDTFDELGTAVPEQLLRDVIRDFAAPTSVQRAVVPCAMAGHDVLATAPTGSGKTLAFLLPLLSLAQDGARAVVLAPTRELAAQIATVARRYAGARAAACVTGGSDKYAQVSALRRARLWVATPGRLIDLVKAKAAKMRSVVAVAVDEADRLLDLGFEPQVRAVLAQVRPDALRMLLSATMPPRVRKLARDVLRSPVVIAPRDETPTGSAIPGNNAAGPARVAEGVREHYYVLAADHERWSWLERTLPALTDGVHGDGGGGGLVVVFCRTRGAAAALANRLRASGTPAACIHGETDAGDRDALLAMFRRGEVRVLVSTDLAARGLHIDGVAAVVNYEPAKDWEWHVHRVGRTGRAGAAGDAHTLLVDGAPHDAAFAAKARVALRALKAPVPPAVQRLAEAAGQPQRRPQRGRWKRGRGHGSYRGGGGGGRERKESTRDTGGGDGK